MGKKLFSPAHDKTHKHIISGVSASSWSQAVSIVCSFFSVAILSRLLSPADFGIAAMVTPVISLARTFNDLGTQQITQQKKEITHEEINFLFWINIALGIGLSLLVMLASPLIGAYYNDERVVPLTCAMSLVILISSAKGQHDALLIRRMEFHTIALTDTITSVGSFVIAVVLAWLINNYWALCVANIAGMLLSVVAAWYASKWRPSLPNMVRGLSKSLRFGLGVTIGSVMRFFSGSLDNILIGKYAGDRALGIYDRGYNLLLFPIQRFVFPLCAIMMPILSKCQDDPARYRMLLLRFLESVPLIICPGIIWIIITCDVLIPTLLGKQWGEVVPIFIPLSAAAIAQVINGPFSGVFFHSQARGGDFARWNIFACVTNVAAFTIGVFFGAIGVATAFAVVEVSRTPLLWRYATKTGPVSFSDLCRTILPVIGVLLFSGASAFAYYSLSDAGAYTKTFLTLPVVYASAALATLTLSRGRDLYSVLFHLCRSKFK